MDNMYRNSSENTSYISSGIYNTSYDHNTPGNATVDLRETLLNLYNYFHKQLTVKEKAQEIFAKPLGLMSFIVCCLSLLGNTTSIVTIIRMSNKKSMHLKLVVSLCISDSLISFSILFDDILYILTTWDSCTRLCKRLMLDLALLATLMNLLAMALDHCVAIIKPIHYRQLMTQFQMNCIITGLWVVSVSAVILEVFVGFALQDDHKRDSLCGAIEAGPDNLEIFIVGFIIVVLFCIMMIYLWIYSRVRLALSQREVTKFQTDSGSFKALVTSLLFIGTFVLFWAPNGVYQIFLYAKSKTDKEYVIQHIERITLVNDVLFLILQLNSLSDPVIYAFRLPNVRSGLAGIFLCRQKRHKKYKSVASARYSATNKKRKVECTVHKEIHDTGIAQDCHDV